MIYKTATIVFCLVLVAGLFGVLPAGAAPDAPLVTYVEPFDTDGNWVNVTGSSLATYGIKEYNNPNHTEVVFHAEVVLRQGSVTQDGFPTTHSGAYAWRLDQNTGSFWRAKVTTGGVGTFSVWVRRWDSTPDPSYVTEYSTDNGASWTSVQAIDNDWLGSSDWKQVSGAINTSNGAGDADDIIIRIRRVSGERLIVDDFEMTDLPLAVTLASFAAEGHADRVVVTWEAVSEFDTAGFNLYRSEDAAGPLTLLAYLPSQAPGSTLGAAYSYDDLDVQPGQTYWYWLEDISLGGATTLHGPVSATVSAPTPVTLASLQATPAAPAIPAAATVLASLAGLMAATGVAVSRRRAR